MLSWMAWTWPTALLLIGIFSAMAIITVIEIRKPGTSERCGVLPGLFNADYLRIGLRIPNV